MKICSRCKSEKPLSEFYVRIDSLDGYRGVCKVCTDTPTNEDIDGRLLERSELLKKGLRRCNKCQNIKFIKNFYKRNDQKDGYSVQCNTCLKSNKREERYKTYIHEGKPFSNDKLILLHKQQNGTCAICPTKLNLECTKRSWALDHDHKTMKVRGLLCLDCNTGLGKFKDNTILLDNALNYLINN